MSAQKIDIHFECPWLTLVSTPDPAGRPYYMIDLADYVAVVAITAEGRALLVRQYRPIVDRVTLELPSGHVDGGESPEDAARRELLEETGYAAGELQLLGRLVPDVGRLRNRLWCFFAPDVRRDPAAPALEAGVTLCEVDAAELIRHAADGTIDHALALAPLFLALATHKLSLPIPSRLGDKS